MKYSLVIPVYGTERYLARCLDSLVRQTDGDFEAIVVDDCSPGDAGRSVIAPYQAGTNPAGSSSPPYQAAVGAGPRAARHPTQEILVQYDSRFRYIRHEKNRGAFQARCTGVAAATGDYVVPVDSDDYLMPETLAKLREVIDRENPDLVSYRMEYDNGKKIWLHWCRHSDATVSGVEALRELTEHKYFTGVASKAFRRETLLTALRELNAPEDFYANTSDDFLMLVAMLVKSTKVTFHDFVGYRYFVNEESTSFSWKTTDGFRRACEQTHQVGELLLRLARPKQIDSMVRTLVEASVSEIERWFVQLAAEGPTEQWEALSKILMESLSPVNVAAELANQMKKIRRSRAYRVGRVLSKVLRSVLS